MGFYKEYEWIKLVASKFFTVEVILDTIQLSHSVIDTCKVECIVNLVIKDSIYIQSNKALRSVIIVFLMYT